jgi:glucosyl-3-phosphoglycerate synthase
MHPEARRWFARRTSASEDWLVDDLLVAKRRGGQTVSVVLPARNEEATVAGIVGGIRSALVDAVPLVDELVVIDSLSTDRTAEAARDAGATVWSVSEVVSHLGVHGGKGEALWKSLFVTSGSIVAFIDADLTGWGTHFVTGLLGPMLTDPGTLLCKGFYDRVGDGGVSAQGGRVTELVARPLIALRWPELAGVVQPLAGEWACRRSLFEDLRVPMGYGVELATLVDTLRRHGLDAIAQVDLGSRAHSHQSVHDLGVMAAEILALADRRSGVWAGTRGFGAVGANADAVELNQFVRSAPGGWVPRAVPVGERPPARTVPGYRRRAA